MSKNNVKKHHQKCYFMFFCRFFNIYSLFLHIINENRSLLIPQNYEDFISNPIKGHRCLYDRA